MHCGNSLTLSASVHQATGKVQRCVAGSTSMLSCKSDVHTRITSHYCALAGRQYERGIDVVQRSPLQELSWGT